MRRGFPILCGAALVFLTARCSTNGDVSDAGTDTFVSTPCSADTDCPTGTRCLYPASDGCSAARRCLPFNQGACKGMLACACNGTNTSVCGGGAAVPVRSVGGPCETSCGSDCCSLLDISAYSPTPQSAPLMALGACAPVEIAAFVTACEAPNATQQSCADWQASEVADGGDAGSACVGCIFTPQSAAMWGALVCTSIDCTYNSSGCVDLALGETADERQAGGAGSCGDLISDSLGCEDYTCNACDRTGAPNSAFDACVQSAVHAQCSAYTAKVDASGPCDALHGDAAPPVALSCFPQSPTDVAAFANVFCGTGP